MKVIVLLAGKGTRFLPLTQTVAKPLIPVGGSPVLAHILRTIEPLNVDELILVTGHLSDQIKSFVEDFYDSEVRIVPQDTLDGTGGAVFAAREHIDCPVLIVFGDTLFDADLTFLNKGDVGNVIWTRQVEDFQRFGIVQKNQAGDMARIVEKPQQDVGRQANIGLYYITDHKALLAGLDHVMAGDAIGGEFFFTYALNHMVARGKRIAIKDVEGWHDCGTRDAILATNEYLLGCHDTEEPHQFGPDVEIIPPVRIHKDVELCDCQVGPNVTIGTGSSISASRIENSMIDAGCTLTRVNIGRSIIGPNEILTDLALEGCIAANGKITNSA